MKINQIHIQNFKSLVDFKLEDLKPFCAFVGPNASGKSNIFEALEFANYIITNGFGTFDFININDILSFNPVEQGIKDKNIIPIAPCITVNFRFESELFINFDVYTHKRPNEEAYVESLRTPHINKQMSILDIGNRDKRKDFIQSWIGQGYKYNNEYENFVDGFSRIFIGKSELRLINRSSNTLLIDASNLPQIIGQIFQIEEKKIDFVEWLQILVPEFENIEVRKSNIDGNFDFFVYEKGSDRPFPRKLLSDGTKNILALMAAVYQSDEPQFLCIEEPENGLHPEAIIELINFFRHMCETKGHHIWLNTHSPTLIRCLKVNELILINKINGITQAKQFTEEEIGNIKTDEAWLTNALGGGVSWSK